MEQIGNGLATALSPVSVPVPSFKSTDTDQKNGAMAKLGKLLNDRAAELIATVSGDLAANLVLTDPKVQQQIIVALDGAEKDLEVGIFGLPTWKRIEGIATALQGRGFPGCSPDCVTQELRMHSVLH